MASEARQAEALQLAQRRPLPPAAIMPMLCTEGRAARALEVDVDNFPVVAPV